MSPRRIDNIGELKNVYLLYGEEEFLMKEAVERLIERFSSEADADFNMEVIDAVTAGADHIVDSAETIPLLSERRLIIVRDYDRLSRQEQGKLLEYVDNPNPATTLVLIARFGGSGESTDKNFVRRLENSKLFKKVKSTGEVLKFSLPRRGRKKKLDDFIDLQFEARGKKADVKAKDLLIQQVGDGLGDLEDAIEKVCLYVDESMNVTEEDISRVIAPATQEGVFDLVDAVAQRRRDVSLYLLNMLLRQGESPQRIFGLLLRQFRLIARVKALSVDSDFRQLSARLGIPPFVVNKCIDQSRKFSSERLREVLGSFRQAQVELHSSKYLGDGDYQSWILESLITRVIG